MSNLRYLIIKALNQHCIVYQKTLIFNSATKTKNNLLTLLVKTTLLSESQGTCKYAVFTKQKGMVRMAVSLDCKSFNHSCMT